LAGQKSRVEEKKFQVRGSKCFWAVFARGGDVIRVKISLNDARYILTYLNGDVFRSRKLNVELHHFYVLLLDSVAFVEFVDLLDVRGGSGIRHLIKSRLTWKIE
jgi:hypothetical protein